MLEQIIEWLCVSGWNSARAASETRRAQPPPKRPPTTDPIPPDAVLMGNTIPTASGEDPRQVWVPLPDRCRHAVFNGSSGMGKSTALRHLFRADIEAKRAVFMLDMQGDLADSALRDAASLASPEELRDRLVWLDLRDERFIVPFNVLQPSGAGDDAFTRALTLLDALKHQSESWGVLIHEVLLCSLAALSEVGWTVLEIEPLLSNAAFRAQVVSQTRSDYVRDFFGRFEALTPEKQAAWRLPVLNKLPFLAVPDLRLLLGTRAGFTFRLYDERPGLIVIVALDGARLQEGARITGALLVASLLNYVLSRSRQPEQERVFLNITLDEAQNFASDKFEVLIAEGRRYRAAMALAHQNLHQMPTALSHVIRNNCGHQWFFGTGALDAAELAREIVLDAPNGDVREILLTQRVGECILSRRGQKSVRVQVAPCPEPDVSEKTLEAVRDVAGQSFARSRAAVEAELRQRTQWLRSLQNPNPQSPNSHLTRNSSISSNSLTSTVEVRHAKRRSFRADDAHN